MTPDHDRLLDPRLLDDVEHQPLDVVRSLRAECVEVETGLSYLRRLVQGALDIVQRELARRAGGGEPLAGDDLVEALPEILGETPRPAGVGRLTTLLEPHELDPTLSAEYDALVADARLADVGDLGATELAGLLEQLSALEHRVGELRRAYFARIDALQGELARRYKTGEASVDQLLRDAGA